MKIDYNIHLHRQDLEYVKTLRLKLDSEDFYPVENEKFYLKLEDEDTEYFCEAFSECWVYKVDKGRIIAKSKDLKAKIIY